LTPAELDAMRDGLLPGLLSRATLTETIPGGFRWRFSSEDGLLRDAGAVIDAEHKCCPFLSFALKVEPGKGPVWLEVTGPDGTQTFLDTLLRVALR
jgi:hypothetical protein